MTRKAIEKERLGMQTPRERLWAAILKLRKGFTTSEVQAASYPIVGTEATVTYIRELEAAGFIVQTGGGTYLPGQGARSSERIFELVKAPAAAPKINDGKEVVQGAGVVALWRAMKVLSRGFTADELSRAASMEGVLEVPRSTAITYAYALVKAGYLKPLAPSKPGVATRWRLVRNTGPHAPAITRRKCVFDRNTGALIEIQTPREASDGND